MSGSSPILPLVVVLAIGCGGTMGKEAVPPRRALEACSSARVGVPCEVPITADDAVASRCIKEPDGSLVCDTPKGP